MQQRVSIRLCSDVHMNQCDMREHDFVLVLPPTPQKVDILALAGDIGNPFAPMFSSFLHYCSSLANVVVLVPGNHEYQTGQPMDNTLDRLRSVCAQQANVFLLDNSTVDYGGYTIVGSTMWSNVDAAIDCVVHSSVSDYNRIPELTASKVRMMHKTAVDYLSNKLSSVIDHKKYIVVTHHAPSMRGTVNPLYVGDHLASCYYTDLDDLVYKPSVVVWMYGHTHWSVDLHQSDCRIVSNQVRSKNYKPMQIIWIP